MTKKIIVDKSEKNRDKNDDKSRKVVVFDYDEECLDMEIFIISESYLEKDTEEFPDKKQKN